MRTVSMKTYFEIAKGVVFLFILLALFFGGLKAYGWINHKLAVQEELDNAKLAEARKYKQYADNLVQANTEIVTSLKTEIDKLKKENNVALNQMLDEIKKRDEKITNMGLTIAKMDGDLTKIRVAADKTYKAGTDDPNAYEFKKVVYGFKDDKGKDTEVPVAWVQYFPNREPDKQWKTGVYDLDYYVRTIQSTQKDGQVNTNTQIWFENERDVASRGVKVPLDIKSSEFKQLKKETKEFFWWAPHLSLNVDLGFGLGSLAGGSDGSGQSILVAGGVSFSAMGYGRTVNDLDWRFLDLGVSTNGHDTYGKFTPFAYNLGNVIPIVSNSFIGPFIGYGFAGDVKQDIIFGVGLSIPF